MRLPLRERIGRNLSSGGFWCVAGECTACPALVDCVLPNIVVPRNGCSWCVPLGDCAGDADCGPGTTSRLNADLDRVFESVGLPWGAASNPGQQDIWFQDTMEIGYTQLPGAQPMHVVMEAQRPNASDDVAVTLLAPDFGFISIGEPRQPGDEEDHWMDWMGNLEVTHPLSGHPLGRIYYGKSDRTTFHPKILEFLEAQQVQKPFAVYTNWLLIQHVDEVLNFLADETAKRR